MKERYLKKFNKIESVVYYVKKLIKKIKKLKFIQ